MSYTDEEVGLIGYCDSLGYGRVMQIAETEWRKMNPRGALVVVCCAAEEKIYRAAPDLLEALKAILPAAGDGYGHNPHAKKPGDCAGCDAVVAARAAIAKATGEE